MLYMPAPALNGGGLATCASVEALQPQLCFGPLHMCNTEA